MTTSTATQTVEQQLSALKIKGAEIKPATPTEQYKYARFLPEWTTTEKLAPLEPFEHVDPGHKALQDPNPLSFLENAEIRHITPDFGTEIVTGVDLTALGDRERAQLALFVAQRGVVVFRDQQKFIDADPEWWINNWTSHFGRPHAHAIANHPPGYPELLPVLREDGNKKELFYFKEKLSTTLIHSDVTYEVQPPGLTALFLFDSPAAGGDTLYVDQVKAYKRLSPSFREYLETLQVEHSAFEQAKTVVEAKGADAIRRAPINTIHPLIRRHPVTGEKALFVNPGFSRRIIGLKQEESEAILALLYDHISKGHDFQARIRWGELGSVTLWDNRVTSHSALIDWDNGLDGQRRHGLRLTPQAERPTL
ncbi:hypothetical protein JCM10908_005234 [Rhodotorula pacifica]|uniref:TauD/TfdA dioxygenase family protein n=1 Tax=Rhodotorula pacifica TaxID=1495444 RepID=UPI00316DE85B